MQVTGILRNKPRILSKVIYLDVAESLSDKAPKKQWIFFKDKHTMQDINTITNAIPGSSLIIDGKDNINKMTGQPQIVVHSLLNIIPPDANIANTSTESDISEIINSFDALSPDPVYDVADTWNQLMGLMRKLPKQIAIGMLAKALSAINGEARHA